MTKCWIVISSLTQSVQGDLNGPPGWSLWIFLLIDEVLRMFCRFWSVLALIGADTSVHLSFGVNERSENNISISQLNHPIYQEITEFLEFIVDIWPNFTNSSWKNIQESQIARRQRDWRIIIADNFIILSYSFFLFCEKVD